MKLSYCQAWKIKENAKEKIYGLPWNYYKLLLWMCGQVVQMNPRSIVYLTYSSDCHFEQLFISHEVSIQGFLLGYRPIIAIDSSHMSGSYDAALFSIITYNANDNMFPLAFGVMSFENYEDWSWFLQTLKKNLGDNKVYIR